MKLIRIILIFFGFVQKMEPGSFIVVPMSHPARVRGLKDIRGCPATGSACWSHPARVRGLKVEEFGYSTFTLESHPARVRGLKEVPNTHSTGEARVAPRAGAWIESLLIVANAFSWAVAPRAGAWIESQPESAEDKNTNWSHPARVRGLKGFGWVKKLPTRASRTPRGCVD